MSPRVRRRGSQPDAVVEQELNADDESETSVEYVIKNSSVGRFQRRLNAPGIIDSEESYTDAGRPRAKPNKRRKTARISSRKTKTITGNGDAKRRGSRRRRKRKQEEEEEEEEAVELPIAELLRKAQESQKSIQTRYEDPVPLKELTTDTLYVQGRNGFSAVKIGNLKTHSCSNETMSKPVHIAVKIHGVTKTVMYFCQGLLGGIALSQAVAVGGNDDGSYSRLASGLFLFLLTMSLLAAMDRIDIAGFEVENIREIFTRRFSTVVTLPLYLVAICVHLGDASVERLGAEADETQASRRLNTWKYLLCIIAWFFIAVGPADDSTTTNLETLVKYAG